MPELAIYVQGINLLITSGVLIYVIRVEHRLTRLETLVEMIQAARLRE